MRKIAFWSFLVLLTSPILLISCSKDDSKDEYEETYLKDEAYQTQLAKVRADGSTALYESGKISGCTTFQIVNNNVFTIDGINYTITDGKAEVLAGGGQSINIYKHIVYEKNFYETTSIAKEAFSLHDEIVEVSIPNSIHNIGEKAFSGCQKITKISIPNSVETIGGEAFKNCTSLTDLNIGNGVKIINQNTFYNCTSLTNVQIEEGLEGIDSYAFYGCESLQKISFPNSLRIINDIAFSGSKVKELTIGSGIEYIGSAAFMNDILVVCTIKAINPPKFGSNVFSRGNFYVPASSIEQYKTALDAAVSGYHTVEAYE